MRLACALFLSAAGALAAEDVPRPGDRPHVTGTPFTVRAGHVQVELDFFRFSRDLGHDNGRDTRLRTFNLIPITIKVGVLDRVDVAVGIEPLRFERIEVFDPTTSVEREGFGDTVLNVKVNLWGNDSGDCALALVPFVKFPTANDEIGNGDVEGGLAIPYFRLLGRGWGLGARLEVDLVRDRLGTTYEAEFVQSLYVQRDVIEQLAVFVEAYSNFSTESDRSWIGTFRLGVIWSVTNDFALDFGGALALSSEAENSAIWIGATIRF